MILNFDNANSIDIVIVGYTIKKKDRIYKFNSLIQRFYNMNQALRFEYEMLEELKKIDSRLTYEVYYISPNKPIKPTGDIKVRGKRYCPYCGQIEKLLNNNGYDMCPICHCSSNDYNFKNYNDAWNKGTSSRTRRKSKS